MIMQPIIFLDMDGVLNNTRMDWESHKARAEAPYIVDDENLDKLERLVLVMDAQIVISSTWRILCSKDFMSKRLGDVVGPRIHDDWKTKRLNGIRGLEVQEWLERNLGPEYWSFKDFLILDDDSDFLWHQPLVRIDHGTGLTDRDVERALAIFKAKTAEIPAQLPPFQLLEIAQTLDVTTDKVSQIYEKIFEAYRS